MRIGIIGTGYVGLVYGAVMSGYGHSVICMDKDADKIGVLNSGKSPIYEPGLGPLLEQGLGTGALSFTTDIALGIQASEVIFIAVGTPSGPGGEVDLSSVLETAETIGKHMNEAKIIVSKSTVPVGTNKQISRCIREALERRGLDYPFEVASNPEFLRQGKAVSDCQQPSRVVIGTDTETARMTLERLYSCYDRTIVPFLFTQPETAEMIKYASNAFLAVKISFANELALLAEKVGADVQEVVAGMGMDDRISPSFLDPGPGYGGSCFPKDTLAILDTGQRNGEPMLVIQAAVTANEKQKARMVGRIKDALSADGNLVGKNVGILGLSFKPETDDIRNTPSHDIIEGLLDSGAAVRVYCPEGMKQAKRSWPELNPGIRYCSNELECAEEADALVVVTEWNQFRELAWTDVRGRMRNDHLFDLRNMFSRDQAVRGLFQYHAVGMAGA